MRRPTHFHQMTLEQLREWNRKSSEAFQRRRQQRIYHPSHKRTLRIGGSRFNDLRPQSMVYKGGRIYVHDATVGQVKRGLGDLLNRVRKVRRSATGQVEIVHTQNKNAWFLCQHLLDQGFKVR